MGKVTILDETTVNPITKMGLRAGICWGSDITDPKKNYKRGLDCLKANHGRVLEYPNIELSIEGYSARVIREWYTHIGCLPTRLQSSTRYINYEDFGYVIPHSINNNKEALALYKEGMANTSKLLKRLDELGIPREDSSMLLPLGMETNIVDKRNLRNLIDMAHTRECTRAYWEFRELMRDLEKALSDYSEEWKYIVDNYFKPKCEVLGYCSETKSCGRKPKKND